MKIHSITIILEPDPNNEYEKDHATTLDYRMSKWQYNGPVFSRFTKASDTILKILNGEKY
jgi:hypothetical protein